MGKLWDLMSIERQEIGYREGANNDTKYGAEYGMNYQPWCVMFQWWCCKQVGVPFPNTAHCNGVEQYAKQQGQWVSGKYEVGDFVIFDYDGDGSRDHIGFIVSVEADYCITTEGNYADQVASVKRKYSEFVGAYRPDWKALDGESGEESEEPAPEPAEEPTQESAPSNDTSGTGSGLPVLQYGDVGQAVGVLQCVLKYYYRFGMSGSFYVNTGRPDEEFGEETERAVKQITGSTVCDEEAWLQIIGGVG